MVSWISLVALAVNQLSVYVCTGAAAAASLACNSAHWSYSLAVVFIQNFSWTQH